MPVATSNDLVSISFHRVLARSTPVSGGGVGKPACPLGAEVSGWRAFELDYDSCIFIIISYVCEKMSSVGRLISEMDNPLFVCDRNPEARFLFRIVRN